MESGTITLTREEGPDVSCRQRIRAAIEQGQIVRIGVNPAALATRGLADDADLDELVQRRACGRDIALYLKSGQC